MNGVDHSAVGFLIEVALIGFIAWLVQAVIPMEARIKQIFSAILVVIVVLMALRFFGIW